MWNIKDIPMSMKIFPISISYSTVCHLDTIEAVQLSKLNCMDWVCWEKTNYRAFLPKSPVLGWALLPIHVLAYMMDDVCLPPSLCHLGYLELKRPRWRPRNCLMPNHCYRHLTRSEAEVCSIPAREKKTVFNVLDIFWSVAAKKKIRLHSRKWKAKKR